MRVEPREESTSRPAWTRGFVILRRSSTWRTSTAEPGAAGRGAAGIEDDALFEAPERGSADELLDAGRPRRARRDAPLDGPRDGRGGPRPVPGHAARDRARDQGRLLLRLQARPAAHAGRPREDRGADGGLASRPTTRSSGSELPPEEGRAFFEARNQPFKVEILDDLAAKAKATNSADAADERLRARPVRRPVQGAARREHGQDRAVQAARGLRRVLARRPEAARPPADLRHGLGRRRRTSTPTSGGAARRRSATIAGSASSSTCTASTTSRRGRRSGTRRASGSGGRSRARCASSRRATATTRSRRRSS